MREYYGSNWKKKLLIYKNNINKDYSIIGGDEEDLLADFNIDELEELTGEKPNNMIDDKSSDKLLPKDKVNYSISNGLPSKPKLNPEMVEKQKSTLKSGLYLRDEYESIDDIIIDESDLALDKYNSYNVDDLDKNINNIDFIKPKDELDVEKSLISLLTALH